MVTLTEQISFIGNEISYLTELIKKQEKDNFEYKEKMKKDNINENIINMLLKGSVTYVIELKQKLEVLKGINNTLYKI